MLFLSVLAAYAPALNGGFLWDDDAHILKGPMTTMHGLWRIWFDLGSTQQYYPLLFTASWVEHHLWGDAVLGYHLNNVVLHVVSSFLVVAIMRRLSLPGAWLGGFLFALHPVCVESVAWMSEQKNTLSMVFYLTAALLYLRYDERRDWRVYLASFFIFILALLSKTVTATLPGGLLVLFWWQRGKLEWRRDVLPLIPWFILGAAAGSLTSWVERKYVGAEGPDFEMAYLDRILLMGRIPFFYLGKLLWPANLIFIYPHWTVSAAVWWQYLFPFGALLLLALAIMVAKRCRWPLAILLLFEGTLTPVSGLLHVFPFEYSYVADHFQYFASLAILAPLASVITLGSKRLLPGRNGLARLAQAVPICVLWALTFHQAGFYRDAVVIYRNTLAQNPSCWMAYNNLGFIYGQLGRAPEAIQEFKEAIAIKPDWMAYDNLGFIYNELGRTPEAIQEFEEALAIKPDAAEAHDNLGLALSKIGRAKEAIEQYEEALRIEPDMPNAHYNFGNALLGIGQPRDAIEQYELALKAEPDDANVHVNLGVAFFQVGQTLDAIVQYEEALRSNPTDVDTHINLGSALTAVGRNQDAIDQYEQALRINPNDADACNNLGWSLLQEGQVNKAIDQFQEALRLRPGFAAAQKNLQMARRRAGVK